MAAPAFGIQIPDSLISNSMQPTAVVIEAPKASYMSIEDYAAAAATEAGISPIMFKHLIGCESVWHEDAAGDHGTSLGILQFKHPTFEMFNEKYGFKGRDIMNPYHQIDLAVLMIRDGYLGHWKNCGHKIGWLPITTN